MLLNNFSQCVNTKKNWDSVHITIYQKVLDAVKLYSGIPIGSTFLYVKRKKLEINEVIFQFKRLVKKNNSINIEYS